MRNKYVGKDIADRLHGTVIRYKENPFLCLVEGNDIVLKTLVGDRIYARVSSDDPDLDISSLPLGYVNHSVTKSAVYIKRNPLRRYKQGVDPGVMQYMLLPGAARGVGHEVFHDKGFTENVADVYPTFSKALSLLTKKDGYTSIALSRDVAISREGGVIKVWITMDEVGYITLTSGSENNRCTIIKTDVSWIIRTKLEKVGISVNEGIRSS